MRQLIPFLFLAASAFAAPMAQNVAVDPGSLGDSGVRLEYDSTEAAVYQRARYGTSSCSAGTGGTVTLSYPFQTPLANKMLTITGLAPSTAYFGCIELSNDAVTWSTGAETTFTTTAPDTTLIAPDAVSTTFPTPNGSTLNVPDGDCDNVSTGLQARLDAARISLQSNIGDTVVIPAGTVCPGEYVLKRPTNSKAFTPANITTSNSNINIVNHGFSDGDEVRVAASSDTNASCLPGNNIYMYGLKCFYGGHGWQMGYRYKVGRIDADNVRLKEMDGSQAIPGFAQITADATADTITLKNTWRLWLGAQYVGSSNSFDANTIVQFVNIGGALPAPLTVDTDYFVKTACVSSMAARCTFQLALTSGGAAINITTAGTGTTYIVDKGNGTSYIGPAPGTQYITVKSGGTLPPIDTRISPGDDIQLASIRQNDPYPPGSGTQTPTISTEPLARNVHFRGLVFDTGTNTDYLTAVDVRGYGYIVYIDQWAENILFDQIHVKCPDYPQRCGGPTGNVGHVDGRNVGFINSYHDNLDSWHPGITGFVPTISSGKGRLSTGSVGTGPSIFGTITTSTIAEFTPTGGTGAFVWYFDHDGAMQVKVATGITGSCTVTGTSTVTGATTCTVSSTAVPAYPTVTISGSVLAAGCKLASGTVTAGAVTVNTFDQCYTNVVTGAEGAQSWIAGIGPGPYILNNNYFNGTGIPWHFADDSLIDRANFTVTRNFFDSDIDKVFGNANSNGMRYWNRNQLEWKGGQKILVDGNIFQHGFSDVSPASVSLAITPRQAGNTSDLNVKNNWFRKSAGATQLCNPQYTTNANSIVMSRPCYRQAFTNNLIQTDGVTNRVTDPVIIQYPGQGWAFYNGTFSASVEVSHNTHWNPLGYQSFFTFWDLTPTQGVVMKDNLISISGGVDSTIGEFVKVGTLQQCGGGVAAKTAADCAWTSGPGNTAYTFTGNAALPLYGTNYSSTTPSGLVDAGATCQRWGASTTGTSGNLCTGSGWIGSLQFSQATAALRKAAVKYVDPDNAVAGDFHLDPTSPLIGAGTAGATIGVNFDALLNANGIVRDIVLTPALSSIAICFTAPDTKAVYLGYSTDSGVTWSYPTTVTGAAGNRCGTVSGLMSSTSYKVRVLDYYDQTAALGFTSGQITTIDTSTTAATRGSSKPRGSAVRGATTQ